MAKSQEELNSLITKLKGTSKECHLDVVDGKFAHNKSLWFKFSLPTTHSYNIHLMLAKQHDPIEWIKQHKLTLKHNDIKRYFTQIETVKNIPALLQKSKKTNIPIGFSLKPSTPTSTIKPYIKQLSHILILTVEPGFYGAPFIPKALKKIQQIKKWNKNIKIIVDGHINNKTILKAKTAGADIAIVGSYLATSQKPKQTMKGLKQIIKT